MIGGYLRQLGLILGAAFLVACEAKLEPQVVVASARSTLSMQVTGRQPFVVSPGSTVTLTGRHFQPSLRVVSFGLSDAPIAVSLQDSSTATFTVPAGAPYGFINFSVEQAGLIQAISIFVDGGKTDYPIYTAVSSTICVGSEFYDSSGALQEGSKDCGIAPCTADGETGCTANSSFPAVQVEGLAAKVVVGNMVAGTTGTGLTPAPPACAVDGERDCVATASFPAVDASKATAANIHVGVTLAGVAGSLTTAPAVCSTDGQRDCITASAFPAANLSQIPTLAIMTGVTAAGIIGTGTIAPANCAADGATGCVAVSAFKAADMAQIVASNILLGRTIAGVVGAAISAPSTCAVDAATGCVASSSFPAVQVSGLADKLLDGTTAAGVAGDVTLPSVSAVLVGNGTFGIGGTALTPSLTLPAASLVLTGTTFGAAGTGATGTLTLPAAGSVFLGEVFGVAANGSTGSLSVPDAATVLIGSGMFGIGGTALTPSLTLPPIGQVLTTSGGYGIAGTSITAGTATLPATAAVLSSSGAYGASGNGVAAGTATLPPVENVYGATFGVAGTGSTGSLTLPSVGAVDASTFGVAGTGSTGTLTLPPVGNVYLSTFGIAGTGSTGTLTLPPVEQVYSSTFGIAGTGSTGSLTLPLANEVYTINGTFGIGGTGTAPTLISCALDGTTNCVAVAAYKAADMSHAVAANILSGATIAGVLGTGVSSPSACNSDGETACVTTSNYISANMTYAVAGNIAFGATIGGVAGSYGLPCSSDGQTGCLTASLFPAAAVSGFSNWNIRTGMTLGGISGALKANCRNGIDSTYFNYDGPLSSLTDASITGGTVLDYWDTIDDFNGFSSNRVTAWSADTFCDSSTWVDVTTSDGGSTIVTCAASPANCQYKDRITNLTATGMLGALAWNAAILACNNSTYGGYSAGTWRLPTQKEVMALYDHGLVSLASTNFIPLTAAAMQNNFWSSTTQSSSPGNAWLTILSMINFNAAGKALAPNVFCVR